MFYLDLSNAVPEVKREREFSPPPKMENFRNYGRETYSQMWQMWLIYFPRYLLSTIHTIVPSPEVYVGWLDSTHSYSQGKSSPDFVEALRYFCQRPNIHYAGHHTCEFCGKDPYIQFAGEDPLIRFDGNWMMLGSADIQVPARDVVYHAPAMVIHYVEKHDYLPPQEFIDAVLQAIEDKG